ncbi:MAG: hypothetical protein Q7J31_15225, partial [Syntrophales bacterium]|nr:hypothetical protein [Syntrophales bacterium]
MKTIKNPLGAIADPDSEALYLQSEQFKQLYRNAPMGLIATTLNSIMLVFVMRNLISHTTLFTWLTAVLLATVVRFFHLYRYRQHSLTAQDIGNRNRWFVLLTALSGILWGAAGIFLFPDGSVAHQGFLVLVLGGMTAGAVVAYAAAMQAFLVFILPILIPLIIRLFLINDEIHIAMGALSLIFTVMIVIMGSRIHAMTLTSFQLLFENTSLVKYLASAKEHAETLNNQLTAEIAERKNNEEEVRRHREHLKELVEERTAELSEANKHLKREVAERIRMEQALRSSEEHFRALIEN